MNISPLDPALPSVATLPLAPLEPQITTIETSVDVKRAKRLVDTARQPREWKVISLRECPLPDDLQLCDTPQKAAEYWERHIKSHPFFNPDCECAVVLILNTRRRIKGHSFISTGTLDTLLIHPREVFRLAVATSAASIVLMHNHPSGEASPSEADIRVTRDLIRAGQVLKIELCDHIIMLSKPLDKTIYAERRIIPSW